MREREKERERHLGLTRAARLSLCVFVCTTKTAALSSARILSGP